MTMTSTSERAVAFDAATIRAATDGFAEFYKLDEGAFGAVYRGVLVAVDEDTGVGRHGGRKVAIKVLRPLPCSRSR